MAQTSADAAFSAARTSSVLCEKRSPPDKKPEAFSFCSGDTLSAGGSVVNAKDFLSPLNRFEAASVEPSVEVMGSDAKDETLSEYPKEVS